MPEVDAAAKMPSTTIKPTVGRVLHYMTNDQDIRSHHRLNGQPLMAFLTGVHSDTCVNLLVVGADGSLHPREKVFLYQGNEDISVNGPFARWMDYQKGQAAKTEALEAKLSEQKMPDEKRDEMLRQLQSQIDQAKPDGKGPETSPVMTQQPTPPTPPEPTQQTAEQKSADPEKPAGEQQAQPQG